MPNLSSGINMALRALQTNQLAIEVIEHNVANANTPGYRRQTPVLSASVPYSLAELDHGRVLGMVGTGVQIDQIKRIASSFVDSHYRGEVAETNRWQAQQEALQPLEAILAETTEAGLIHQIDKFFSQFQAVSAEPLDTSKRQLLLEEGVSLANAFQRRAAQIDATMADLNVQISQQVDEINDLATQIANLNSQIAQQANNGSQPNDLLDQRDRLLDQLSVAANINSFEQPNGEVLVSIGGHVLIASNTSFKLNTTYDSVTGLPGAAWEDGLAADIQSGRLAGLLSTRTGILPDLRANLDTLAGNLIESVNDLHATGFGLDNIDGRAFFAGDSAGNMRIDTDLAGHPERIAAAQAADSPGDNRVARQIAELAAGKLMDGDSQTFGQYYNSQMTRLGIEINFSTARAAQHQSAVSAIDTQRESISGVDLNEEAANLVRYQRAYQAAGRIMTAVDEMLDQVINRMGLVGR